MLNQIGALPFRDEQLSPETLLENPLYVWGAAVTDGFITDDEMPRAAAFVDAPFTGPGQPDVTWRFQIQALAVAHMLDHFLGGLPADYQTDTHVERFVWFCELAGYGFPLNR